MCGSNQKEKLERKRKNNSLLNFLCISSLLIKQTDMENFIEHIFGDIMKDVDELVKDSEKIIENDKLKTTKGTKKN
jgi:hypothetical protein